MEPENLHFKQVHSNTDAVSLGITCWEPRERLYNPLRVKHSQVMGYYPIKTVFPNLCWCPLITSGSSTSQNYILSPTVCQTSSIYGCTCCLSNFFGSGERTHFSPVLLRQGKGLIKSYIWEFL